MISPAAWMITIHSPSFNSSKILFQSFDEAVKYKDNEELLYSRIKYSEPVPLYTKEIPDGYVLTKKESKSFLDYTKEKLIKFFIYKI